MGSPQWSVRNARFALWRLRDHVRHLLLGRKHVAATFERIHAANLWADQESVSGRGSSAAATVAVRDALPPLMRRLGVQTLLDAPCGDFNWMKEVAAHVPVYHGVDIVEALIARNREAYGSERVQFHVADLTVDPLPRADLILCRDCFIHLPTRLIEAALRNFARSQARYLLLGNDTDAGPYHDIPVGSYRPVNFMAAPFGFPAPDAVITELASGRQLCLWEIARLPVTRAA